MKRIIKLIACFAAALILSSCANTGNQGGTDDDTHVHKVLHWEMVNDADCENGGNRFGMCIDCGNEVRDDLSALEHIYIGGVCARCGKEDKNDGAPEFTFELNSEKTGYIIASALVTKKNVVIPSTYMGLPVVKIAQFAFLGAEKMENLTIPDSVSSIGIRAFAKCDNLKYVKMSEGLTSIGEAAFENCTSLREISFPKTLEKISYGCFNKCIRLEKVSAPGCIAIGGMAFNECERLYSFEFTSNLKSIEKGAFKKSSLFSVDFPENVTYIGESAFEGVPIKSLTLPAGIKEMGGRVFINCSLLESVVINTSNINSEFENCTDLKTIIFGEGVKNVSEHMITDRFAHVETLYLPGSLEYFGESLRSAGSLKRIVYNGTVEQWLALKRNFYWHFMGEECVLECTDATLSRDDLKELEAIE